MGVEGEGEGGGHLFLSNCIFVITLMIVQS